MVGLAGRHEGRVRDKREVDTRVRHQVGLELHQVHVEAALEAQRGRDGRHHLHTPHTHNLLFVQNEKVSKHS